MRPLLRRQPIFYLAKGRTLFHLSTLEATLIKMLKPERALSRKRLRLRAKITSLIWTRETSGCLPIKTFRQNQASF